MSAAAAPAPGVQRGLAAPRQDPAPDELSRRLDEIARPVLPVDPLAADYGQNLMLYKFRLLSEALRSSDPRSSQLVSALKQEIFNDSISNKLTAAIAANVAQRPEFSECYGEMKAICDKVTYLAKNKFSRAWHHLRKNLGNFQVTSKGANYLLAGIGFLVILGPTSTFSTNSTMMSGMETTSTEFSPSLSVIGIALVAAPFVDAIIKGRYSHEP